MRIVKTTRLDTNRFSQVNELWNSEYPAKLKDRLGLLLKDSEESMHYIIEDHGQINAWAVWFKKDNEIRFSLIVKAIHQGKGLGKSIIVALKNDLDEVYGWVIDNDRDKKQNGDHYQSPLGFYKKMGFSILSDIRIDNEFLNAVKIHWKKIDLAE